MPNKAVISNFNANEKNVTLTYGTCSIFKILKNSILNSAESLLIKLPNPADKFNLQSVIRYHSNFTISDSICLSYKFEEKVLKIIKNSDSSEAAGVDKLSGSPLKNGTNILVKPASCNLSISQGSNAC